MNIFGADAFTDKDTAINGIPVNYIKHGDTGLVKIGDEFPEYESAIYFYEYKKNFGGDEDIPSVITPLDQFDINIDTGLPGDDGGRWVLKNLYSNKIVVADLSVDTITALTSGGPINIGDNFTVDGDGVIVDGQVTINSDITEPPLVINSNVLVENLNAQLLNGNESTSFLRNDDHHLQIPMAIDELVVTMPHSMASPEHYTVMISMCNLIDPNPTIYGFTITDKQETNFTVRFSGIIDSENYTLHYFLIGAVGETIPPTP